MKQNRAYKKGEGFKDASLIVIVCEGAKREPEYFTVFEKIHPKKCKVEILDKNNSDSSHKSAPKWLVEKVKKYREDVQIGEGDYLFIVSDTDRWKLKSLHDVNQFCEGFNNYFFILSNPCFEVWLYYHLKSTKSVKANSCREWKQIVHEKTINGFIVENYLSCLTEAINRAKNDDANPNYFLPDAKSSKVYKIIDVIINKVGKGNFDLFVKENEKYK